MKKITLTILILTLSYIFSNNTLYSRIINGNNFQEKVKVEILNWNFNYEATIQYIKEHEGFNKGYAYYCVAGYQTIGYGHLIQEGESFPYRLTKKQADNLLREDFNKALELVEKNTELTGTKKLAIAHFVFTKGIGSFLNSSLKKCIDNNLPVDEELLKWCYYTKPDGTKIRSDYAYKIRLWELEMYNK